MGRKRFVDKRGSLEERVRQAIAQRTLEHGRRAVISRLIGQQRGWATEYVTGKIKNITLDELAQVAYLLHLDVGELLSEQVAVPAGLPPERLDTLLSVLTLWPSVPDSIAQGVLRFLKTVVDHDRDLRRAALDRRAHESARKKASSAVSAGRKKDRA